MFLISNSLAASKTSANSFATSFSSYSGGRDASSEDDEEDDGDDAAATAAAVDDDVGDVEASGTKALVNSSSTNFAASSRNF